jgi:hypothetical protein
MEERDRPPGPGWLVRWVPMASWLPRYQRGWLTGDAIENAVVSSAEPVRAVVLVLDGNDNLDITSADHVFPTTPAAVAWAQSVADTPAPGLCCLQGDDPCAPRISARQSGRARRLAVQPGRRVAELRGPA